MWSNEKEFSDQFSMYLLRKTCAAYHVVPSDLGFTEDVEPVAAASRRRTCSTASATCR